jgi:penicillin-binding protein 1A
VVADFLKVALADKPAVPFRVPAGIKLIRIDAKTGMRVGPGQTGGVILEAFKPGTAPPDSYSVIGYSGDQQQQQQEQPGYVSGGGGGGGGGFGGFFGGGGASPDADRAVRRGTGGLY